MATVRKSMGQDIAAACGQLVVNKRRMMTFMESKKFKRNKEDFTCKHCGFFVRGNGYTNHCSKCLWGCHVDIYPGDRLESCEGMMEPVDIFQKKEKISLYTVVFCVSTNHEINFPRMMIWIALSLL